MAVAVGDLATENDAARLRQHGAQAEQIVTGTVCHLDAAMVQAVLPRFDLAGLDVLFLENVGNLVCPSSYDLGEAARAVLISTAVGFIIASRLRSIRWRVCGVLGAWMETTSLLASN